MLDELAIDQTTDTREVRVGTELLRALGASADARATGSEVVNLGACGAGVSAAITGNAAPAAGTGLPEGTLPVARGYALAAAGMLAALTSRPVAVPTEMVERIVLAPLETDTTGATVTSRIEVGRGTVCADLGARGDAALFEAMLSTLSPADRDDPEAVAAEAQSWRIPVMPYRRRAAGPVSREPAIRKLAGRQAATGADQAQQVGRGPQRSQGQARLPLAGITVCDLTTMWAGPLATAILARLGATVVKVEPSCRLDGLRGSVDGGAGSVTMFEQLNRGKLRADLDLRVEQDRGTFEELVRRSDLVVDSFSPRVMPNLGYSPERLWELNPNVLIAGLRAYPDGPWRCWSGYGTGIHAASGLADSGDGTMRPAIVSYPDPLAGLALVAAMLAQLYARSRRQLVTAVEATLWGAVAPLRGIAVP